eukprot:TRINITY_DN5777_c0_g1_i1.p1 TRINITY_DN5777_c0_g1~~TRINITY_DN5777_c0_g1_i1.p1  ORF type:complete len:865 (+),score=325.35 TRINITY_DN5777_c0_g1_i1:84-2678(+)
MTPGYHTQAPRPQVPVHQQQDTGMGFVPVAPGMLPGIDRGVWMEFGREGTPTRQSPNSHEWWEKELNQTVFGRKSATPMCAQQPNADRGGGSAISNTSQSYSHDPYRAGETKLNEVSPRSTTPNTLSKSPTPTLRLSPVNPDADFTLYPQLLKVLECGVGVPHRRSDKNEKEVIKRVKEDIDKLGYDAMTSAAFMGKDPQLYWKICMCMAEESKKKNLRHAIRWLTLVVALVPELAAGWCELAKTFDDHDSPQLARFLLKAGLAWSAPPETFTLCMKALRHIESDGEVPRRADLIRHILRGTVIEQQLDKVWKVVLEGALFESRFGNDAKASLIINNLLHAVPRQCAVYLEAAKHQEKNQKYLKAFSYIEMGLRVNPKFGPLVFAGVRLLEKRAVEQARRYASQQDYESPKYSSAMRLLLGQWRKAEQSPSLFKLMNLMLSSTEASDAAQMGLPDPHDARGHDAPDSHPYGCRVDLRPLYAYVERCKKFLCPDLVWRLDFEVAQAEERAGYYEASRVSFAEAYTKCQSKVPNLKWKVMLCGARMEIARNDLPKAFALLLAAYKQNQPTPQEEVNKTQNRTLAVIKLELARYYEYMRQFDHARATLEEARLTDWRASLEQIGLELQDPVRGMETALHIAEEGLTIGDRPHRHVGRLWAALVQLYNEKGKARGYNHEVLNVFAKAKEWVGKAGEVWCEGARIYMDPLQGELWDLEKAEECIRKAMKYTPQYGDSFVELVKIHFLKNQGKEGPWVAELTKQVMNAEPNYGPLWQYCKTSPLMTCGEVLHRAIDYIKLELKMFAHIYNRCVGPGARNHYDRNLEALRETHRWLFITAIPSLTWQLRSKWHLAPSVRRRLIFGCEPIQP